MSIRQPSCLVLIATLLLGGCHTVDSVHVEGHYSSGHAGDDHELVVATIWLDESIAHDVFLHDFWDFETDVYLVAYDEVTGHEIFRDQIYWGISEIAYEVEAYEHLTFELEAYGEYEGAVLLADIEVLFEGELVDIAFDRLDDGRVVTLVNDELHIVHYDPCLCFDG